MQRHHRWLPAGLALLFVALPAAAADLPPPARWLRDYLRIDTSNPPGNEHRAAAFLSGLLHDQGVETRLLVTPEGRTSLYARLDGPASSEGALLLLHHMDVVPAGSGWTREPFGGELAGGALWGRGAVDDKSLGIAHLAAFLRLAEETERLARDLIYLAVADEESGGGAGTAWLLEQHADLFADVDAVFTEGGSNRASGDTIAWWGVEVAQKRPLWLEVSAEGRAGHASRLNLHSAPNRLIHALDRILKLPRRYRITPEALQYLEAVAQLGGQEPGQLTARLERALRRGEIERTLAPGQHDYFLDTLQITVLDAGEGINTVPGGARALIDMRLLPDTDSEAVLRQIRSAAGEDVDVSVLLSSPTTPGSPTSHPVYSCVDRTLRADAPVVPAFIPGITDARHFRARDIPVFGISPFALGPRELQGIHGPDERIPLDRFLAGVDRMAALVRNCATSRVP